MYIPYLILVEQIEFKTDPLNHYTFKSFRVVEFLPATEHLSIAWSALAS